MGFKTLTTRTVLAFAGLDAIINPLVIALFVQVLGVGGSHPAALVLSTLVILKMVVCTFYIRAQLQAYETFAATCESGRTADLLHRADGQLQRVVIHLSLFHATAWALVYALGFFALRLGLGQGLLFNSCAWQVVGLLIVGVWFGGIVAAMPLVAALTATAAGECSTSARQLAIPLQRVPESLQARIVLAALALALCPTAISTAVGYAKQVQNGEQQNQLQAEALVTRLAERFDPRAAPTEQRRLLQDIQSAAKGTELTLLDRHGRSLVTDADGEITTPAYGAEVIEHAKRASRDVIRNSGRAERIAFRQLQGGVMGVARVDAPSSSGGYILLAVMIALAMAFWATTSALIFGRALTAPLERLITTIERIVEEGRQSEMSALAVAHSDEIGVLSERFNDLLEMMRDLRRAADAIAAGELGVKITRKGELPDAFRRMLESLRGIVLEIHETSVDLASAATEILAASQEQESAAASQWSAMEEINRTMESLSSSAAHVSDSVEGVLANAEQTLSTTDQMVARIAALSGQTNRIGEILEVIREIADRSDLLALNGSLEASRAGESGHGFALVAAEMRRLAERVTASVEDVKGLVSDIRDAGSSTVAATEEGRRLADGTTEAARQITFVTQQQRSGTEQVSASIRNITTVVTQVVSATAQTRTSAQGLKGQADRLSSVVKRFELGPGEAI